MDMKCEILEVEERLQGVVRVRVPGVYPGKGDPLPVRIAKLVLPAAESLVRVYEDIVAGGGHLYISDMFRSAADQQKAHEDWKSGRKIGYSPPSCSSVHEAARAIDIDAFDTGVGHKVVRRILNQRGWTNIVKSLSGSECWHYEFRGDKWNAYCLEHGPAAMARGMKEEIGNLAALSTALKKEAQVKRIQESLNKILKTRMPVDGIYGPRTRMVVSEFQRLYHLQVDGVAGPITVKKLEDVAKSKE